MASVCCVAEISTEAKHANQLATIPPRSKAPVLVVLKPTLSQCSELPVWTAACTAN